MRPAYAAGWPGMPRRAMPCCPRRGDTRRPAPRPRRGHRPRSEKPVVSWWPGHSLAARLGGWEALDHGTGREFHHRPSASSPHAAWGRFGVRGLPDPHLALGGQDQGDHRVGWPARQAIAASGRRRTPRAALRRRGGLLVLVVVLGFGRFRLATGDGLPAAYAAARARAALQRDDAVLDGVADEFHHAFDFQFAVDVVAVVLDGLGAEVQVAGDFLGNPGPRTAGG